MIPLSAARRIVFQVGPEESVTVRQLIMELRKIGNHDAIVHLWTDNCMHAMTAIETEDVIGHDNFFVVLRDRGERDADPP